MDPVKDHESTGAAQADALVCGCFVQFAPGVAAINVVG